MPDTPAKAIAPTMDAPSNENKPARRAAVMKFGVVAGAVATLFASSRFVDVLGALQGAVDWIEGLGLIGVGAFILLYILATVFFVPGLVLTLGGGAAFGFFKGTLIVSIASTLGATAAFLAGRYFARDWVGKKIEGNARFSVIDNAVTKEGWKIVGLTRLSPAFPFNLLNYAYGLTSVSLRDYFFASWIGMLPATAVYVFLGSTGLKVADLGMEDREPSSGELVLYGVGIMAAVVVTVFITRTARRALQERVDMEPDADTTPES
jgi:uncharacterized membrane protein YdjX (TVP38/TMEM64 family)